MSKARSSHAAIKRYVKPLQRALSCVSKTDQWLAGRPTGKDLYRLAIAGGGPVQIRFTDREPLYLDAGQTFDVYYDGSEYRVRTEGYIYIISPSERLDSALVAWHWHPPNRSRPHMHFDRPLGHIPTGRVTFESVVRYAIEELEAIPARKDWDDVLLATESLHVRYRSWNVDPAVEPPDG